MRAAHLPTFLQRLAGSKARLVEAASSRALVATFLHAGGEAESPGQRSSHSCKGWCRGLHSEHRASERQPEASGRQSHVTVTISEHQRGGWTHSHTH